MMGMVVAGSLCTIVGKIMDQKVRLPETGEDGVISLHETEFKHPLVMNLLMFLGEASLLLVLRLQMASDPIAAASHEQNKLNPLTFTIPALLDTIGSFAGFTGLMLISPSTYQILKMLCMVFVVMLSVIVFRKNYSYIQYAAVLTVILGLTVVTLADIYKSGNSKSEVDAKNTSIVILGVVCMIVGQLFHACQMIVEEYILQRSGSAGQQPCYMMGWEGVFGIIFTTMIALPSQYLDCPFSEDQCVNGHIDDISLAY